LVDPESNLGIMIRAALTIAEEDAAQSERQRLKEALLSDKAMRAAGGRLPGSEHDTAEDWAKEAIEAALDTLEADRG
jgi:hypothetical protein